MSAPINTTLTGPKLRFDLVACGIILALGMLVSACGHRAATNAEGDGGPSTTSDGGVLLPDLNIPLQKGWNFIPDDKGSTTAAAALKLNRIDGNRAMLDLVVHGVPQLQGIAFRLQLPASRITVINRDAAAKWARPFVAEFRQQKDGELWGGVGHVGQHGISATAQTTVVQLTLDLLGDDPIPIQFPAGHGLVLNPEGEAVQVPWLGGQFVKSPGN